MRGREEEGKGVRERGGGRIQAVHAHMSHKHLFFIYQLLSVIITYLLSAFSPASSLVFFNLVKHDAFFSNIITCLSVGFYSYMTSSFAHHLDSYSTYSAHLLFDFYFFCSSSYSFFSIFKKSFLLIS